MKLQCLKCSVGRRDKGTNVAKQTPKTDRIPYHLLYGTDNDLYAKKTNPVPYLTLYKLKQYGLPGEMSTLKKFQISEHFRF